MFGLYSPVLILQAFCVYHAYRHNAEQRWYWLIIFFPLVGCIIYLIHNFNNRATISTITETVKVAVNSNYKIEQLEKALRFSDNVRNKINLADAYYEIGRFADAASLYSSCLEGFMADDVTLQTKLLNAHFHNGSFEPAIDLGKKLESEKSFKNAEVRATYAWALFCHGDAAQAERVFESMDISFSNYHQRVEYCKFLLKAEKVELAKEKLATLMEELEHMKGHERRLKRDTIREIKNLYGGLVRA